MNSPNGKLTNDPFIDIEANFACGDNALMGQPILRMNKARRMGWKGFVDTRESLFEISEETAKIGMLPLMKVDVARLLL